MDHLVGVTRRVARRLLSAEVGQSQQPVAWEQALEAERRRRLLAVAPESSLLFPRAIQRDRCQLE
jgi:hypothetical protein